MSPVNGEEAGLGAVDAVLPSGRPLRVRVADGDAGGDDGIGSVGLVDAASLEEAVATVAEVATLVRDRLDAIAPSRATVEFGVSFEGRAGKLIALVFEGKAQASLTVTLEWEREQTQR